MKVSFLALIFSIYSIPAFAGLAEQLKNGDIVFIQSKSSQSKALEEVTASKWTHMGIAFKLSEDQQKVVDNSEAGQWTVVHSGGPVRFDALETFLNSGTKYTVKRLKEGVSFEKAQKLFKSAKPYADKRTPYDIYFTTQERYCSGYVSLVFKKALGVELGVEASISDLKLNGPEAKKIIQQRFSVRANAPFSVEKWKEKTTITPVSIYDSPLLVPLP